jgi:hypothetical protein
MIATSTTQPETDMTMQRKFTTAEGREVELIGATTNVQVWIDGRLYRTVNGLHNARRVAVDYSRRHGAA